MSVAPSSTAQLSLSETGGSEATADKAGPKLTGAALEAAVQKQVEFYLSRENLQNDGYLVSQMDNLLNVPVNTIHNFPKIASLTKDVTVVVKAIKQSELVSLTVSGDNYLVKPNFSLERNTIILRDIASDIPADDIKALFAEVGATAVSVRSDVNDVWFVRLENEEAAKTALLGLLGKEFKGKPVRGGLKTESLLRSVTPKGSSSQGQSSLSDKGHAGPGAASAGGNAPNSNHYRPQQVNMPAMFAPMQGGGMPPLYGYMNGMPMPGPPQYMNNGMPYMNGGAYMNAPPQMYRPQMSYQGGKGKNMGGGQRGNRGGSGNNGNYNNYGGAGGSNQRFGGGRNQGNNGSGGRRGGNQGNGNGGRNGQRYNQQNGAGGGQFYMQGAPGMGGNKGDGAMAGNSSKDGSGKRSKRKGGNKDSKKSQDSQGKSKSNSGGKDGKGRRGSKNTKINFNSASDFPSLGRTTKAPSANPTWGSGDGSATRSPPPQDAKDAKMEAFSRLKSNVEDAGNAKKAASSTVKAVIEGAVSTAEQNASTAAAPPAQEAAPAAGAKAADTKTFSWAATVAKTANVPVKPAAAPAKAKGGKDAAKKGRGKEPKGKAKGGKPQGASGRERSGSGNQEARGAGQREGSSVVTPAAGPSVPAPRRGWERPELTEERERARVQKEKELQERNSAGDKEDSGSSRSRSSSAAKASADQAKDRKEDKKKSASSQLDGSVGDSDGAKGAPASSGGSRWGSADNSANGSGGRPTFADIIKKKSPPASRTSAPGSNGSSKPVANNSRANAFAEATGAQSSARDNFKAFDDNDESNVAWGDRMTEQEDDD